MKIEIERTAQGYYVVKVEGYATYLAGTWPDLINYLFSVLRNI